MNKTKKIEIIAFVGLDGTGKSTVATYIIEKGFPKVVFNDAISDDQKDKDLIIRDVINQIHNLINAGQHRIIIEELSTWTEFKKLKHEFPGELTIIAIVSPKHLRHHRLLKRPSHPLSLSESDQSDWFEIENLEKGGPIAIADHYIINDGNIEKLHRNVDAMLSEIQF